MIPSGPNSFKPLLTSQRLCIPRDATTVTADSGVIHVVDKVQLPGTRPACH